MMSPLIGWVRLATNKLAGLMSAADKTKLDAIAVGAVSDHGALTGLADDDHTQYALVTGARAFTGTISTKAIAAALGTITSALAALDATVTWNSGGVTFTAIKAAITDTASNAGSKLLDLLVDGSSKYQVGKTGNVAVGGAALSSTFGIMMPAGVGDKLGLYDAGGGFAYGFGVQSSILQIYTAGARVGLGYGGRSASFVEILGIQSSGGAGVLITGVSQTGASANGVLDMTQTWNTTGTPTAIKANVTDTASNAASLLLDLLVGSASKMSVRKDGRTSILKGTAIPAGGTAGTGLLMSSTTNFGVFFGSGAPSLSAAKGSLYLRSDGTGTNDRAYINTDGATTWTAIVTVA